jgi:hypothetical protein
MTSADKKKDEASDNQSATNEGSPNESITLPWLKNVNKFWRVEAAFPNLDFALQSTPTPKFDDKNVIVALDSSVILSPYDISDKSFRSITSIYSSLKADGRLVVPAHAVREFAKRRDALLANLMGRLASQEQSADQAWLEYPFLQHVAKFKKLEDSHRELKQAREKYNRALEDLVVRIGSWRGNDPVTSEYRRLFDSSVLYDPPFKAEEIEKIWKQRLDAKIPPGFSDKEKNDSGIGDFLIWVSVVEKARTTNRDVIFVINDLKEDWFHRNGSQKLPRPELIHEFWNSTGGKNIAIIDLPSLLKGFGASRQDVENAEVARVKFVSRQGRLTNFAEWIKQKNLESNGERWQIDYEVSPAPQKVRDEARLLARRYGATITGDQDNTIRFIFNIGNLPSDDEKRRFKELRAYLFRSGEGWSDPDPGDAFS